MRLPGPIEDRAVGARFPTGALLGVSALVVVGVVVWMSRSGSDDDATAEANTPVGAEVSGFADGTLISPLPSPARVLDTRVGQTTVDGQSAGLGAVAAGSTLEVPVAGRVGGDDAPKLVAITVTATAGPTSSDLVVQPCDHSADATSSLGIAASTTVTRNLIVPLGATGSICFVPSAPVDIVADVEAFLDPGAVRPFPSPVRVVDTTAAGSTVDGAFAGVGVRPTSSTLRVPIANRFDGLADVGALVLSISAVDPLESGDAVVFAAEAPRPEAVTLAYEPGATDRATTLVPVGPSGELCISTTGRTDVVVELLALVPSASAALLAASTEGCPDQSFFPTHRVVALYGTERSARLGVLGEQSPAASAARVADVAAPWRAGDRPVLPAFELIATLATGTPEDRGVYNIRSSPEFVQAYLDVARRHGYYLILDIQPGQSDFLTEATYYEEFLRQPDVGIALDPEWRTQAPARPKGGFVGQVDASEVNAVIDYVARLVAEEGLPEKLVVVHQFQDRMITNKDQLVEQPGVALTIHMDGFGDRPNKLDSYDVVRVGPPLNMGLKLFYDEDINLLSAAEVLAGLFDPVPDMITYQ